MGVFHVFELAQMLPNRTKHHINIEPIFSWFLTKWGREKVHWERMG